MNDKKELTISQQTIVELACIGVAILVWIILVLLIGLTEVFCFVLLGYHIIGGLLNKDIAKSTIRAIAFAPIYVGKKVALYIQAIQVNGKFNDLTKENLLNINHSIVDYLNRYPDANDNDILNGIIFGCSTYGELKDFNNRVISSYDKK